MAILPPIDPTNPVSAYDPTQALHTPSGVLPPILSGGNVVDPNADAHGQDLAKRGLLSHMLGKQIYQAEKPPEPTAPMGTPEYFQQRGEQLTYDKEHPWGSAISEHPGVLGKIFHGLAKAGNIAGDVLEPGLMGIIPGTDMNKTLQERENLSDIAKSEQLANQTTEANAEGENADTSKERADTEKASEEKPKEESWEVVPNFQGPNGEPILQEKNSGQMKVATSVPGAKSTKTEKPQTFKAVTVQLPNGQKAPGKVDQEGNLLTAEGAPAPKGTMLYQQPNYGQLVLPTKTQTVIGRDGLPTIMGWNAQTQAYDRPMGTSATGAYGHEMAQAGAVERGGEQLIGDIQANKDKLGTLGAWVNKHGLNTPIADPDLAGLQSELKTFAALQPAMHGFRSRSAQEAFENIIGDLQKNPDATIASIRGILKTAGAINPNMNNGAESGSPPAGAKVRDYSTLGK
jgi:hypothetical protein